MAIQTNRKSASKRYILQALQIVFALFLIELLAVQLLKLRLQLTPMLVSFGFALLVEIFDALIWKRLEGKEDETKASFFMAVSGFRFLLACLVLFIYYMSTTHEGMVTFVVMFAPYYLALLVHHSLFFSRYRVNKETYR